MSALLKTDAHLSRLAAIVNGVKLSVLHLTKQGEWVCCACA
jgi:hypothetical protein